jgi:predicted N-acyltransferase
MNCTSPVDAPEVVLTTSAGVVRIYRRADDISEADWARAFPAHRKDFRYHAVLDETMSGQFDHRYLVLEDHGGAVLLIQPFFILPHDLAGELPGALQSSLKLIRKRFPRFLLPKMLMTGPSIGDGALAGLEVWQKDPGLLCEALDRYARQCGCSLIILKDIVAAHRREMKGVEARGYTRIPSFPGVTLPLDFDSFENFLNKHASKKTRYDVRRKLKKSAQLASLQLEVVSDITPFADRIHELYLAVAQRSAVPFDVLTKDYFRAIGQRMPESTRFFLWRLEGRIVAFSFCMIRGDTIYNHDIGLDYSVALDLHLYFVARRDTLQWSIENGFKHYYSSPFGYEPKLRLGFKLVAFDLYVRHTSRLINFFVHHLAPRFAPPKSDPLLAKFSNYGDLW